MIAQTNFSPCGSDYRARNCALPSVCRRGAVALGRRAAERVKNAGGEGRMARPKAVVREIAATTRATPLALAPLIQPYRKLGKVSLRVERMQRFARLSRGRNNGDGSWSLASDELDDLEYLCADG